MADNFSIHVDTTEVTAMLRAAQADIPAFIEEVEREIALETKTTEQEMVPVKTGELRRSVDAFERRGGYLVGPTARRKGVPYAIYVARDTREHIIRAKNKKALHWMDGGNDMFAKSVMHPGTTGTPFDIFAFEEMKLKANPMMEKIAEKHMREWS